MKGADITAGDSAGRGIGRHTSWVWARVPSWARVHAHGTATRARVVQTASLLAGALLWEVCGRVWGSSFTLPPLSDVLAAAPGILSSSEFWSALGTTSVALALGLAIVLPSGYLLGVLSGLTRFWGRFIQPYMTVGLATPMIAVIPVIVLLFGLGLGARLAVVVIFALPYLTVNVAAGYRYAPADLIDMATSFGVSRSGVFLKIRTMSALPAIFAGLRLAVSRGLVGVIIAELLVLATGLGRLLERESANFRTANMFVIIIVIVGGAAVLLRVLGEVERRVLEQKGIVRQ